MCRSRRDVDAVLTTRELAKLIKRSGINWAKLPEEEPEKKYVSSEEEKEPTKENPSDDEDATK